MSRVRHCVQCPTCRTRYLLSFSPYGNGSYLITSAYGSLEEYALYCSCRGVPMAIRMRWNDVKKCEVSKAAYERGYGAPNEIFPIENESADLPPLDVAKYLDNWKSLEKRKSSA